jgi:hypothetical protein
MGPETQVGFQQVNVSTVMTIRFDCICRVCQTLGTILTNFNYLSLIKILEIGTIILYIILMKKRGSVT